MKQILTVFVLALSVGGCTPPAPVPPNKSHTPIEPQQLPDRLISELPLCSANPTKLQSSCFERQGDPDSSQRALVIGNDKYEYQPLTNPANDTRGMSDQLVKMGFYVTRAHNLNKQTMDKVINDFGKRLSDIEAAFFYFSGHGAHVDGKNFLIPTNNQNIRFAKDLKQQAVAAKTIL